MIEIYKTKELLKPYIIVWGKHDSIVKWFRTETLNLESVRDQRKWIRKQTSSGDFHLSELELKLNAILIGSFDGNLTPKKIMRLFPEEFI